MSKRQRKTKQKQRRHERARPSRGRIGVGAGLTVGATLAAGAATANAETFTVTSTADTAGNCPTPPTCVSLRQAINSANAAPNATDTNDVITFAATVTGSINLLSDLPHVTEGVDITGPGADVLSVDGGGLHEIFYLDAGADTQNDKYVNISGLTIADGAGSTYSGGINNRSGTQTTVSDSVITGNTGALSGGGIYNGGQLILKYSQVSGNSAQYGGGVHNSDGFFAAVYSTISGNHAVGSLGSGGGIRNVGNASFVLGSTVSGNDAVDGAGIYSTASASNPAAVLAAYSTVSGNQASDDGGGVMGVNEGLTYFTTSTISGNTAVGDGGGFNLDLIPVDPGKYPRFTYSTVAGNSADEAGGMILANDDAYLYNTLFADNTAASYPDLSGTVRADFSLVENISGANVTDYNVPGSNILGADPQLGPLADNGGPTMTRALAPTSPAVDKGSTVTPDDVNEPKYGDQRFYPRTIDFATITNSPAGGNGTDIGAFELQSLPPPGAPAAAAPPRCKGKTATVFRPYGRNLTGTNKRDVIVGTNAKDKINSRGGNDLVCAKGGKDTVNGGAGKDKLFGQGGKDTLKGKGGKDKLVGGAKKDKLIGGAGADKLLGKGGNDTCVGGPGKDVLKSC